MHNIFENLKDPSWWFTAVFVAAIASLLGTFLHVWLSRISKRYSLWKESKRKKEEAEISLVASNETLIAVEMQRCLLLLILYLFLFGTYLGSYAFFASTIPQSSFVRYMYLAVCLMAGVCLIPVGIKMGSQIDISKGAFDLHRARVEASIDRPGSVSNS